MQELGCRTLASALAKRKPTQLRPPCSSAICSVSMDQGMLEAVCKRQVIVHAFAEIVVLEQQVAVTRFVQQRLQRRTSPNGENAGLLAVLASRKRSGTKASLSSQYLGLWCVDSCAVCGAYKVEHACQRRNPAYRHLPSAGATVGNFCMRHISGHLLHGVTCRPA
jgi:hypothetical protein